MARKLLTAIVSAALCVGSVTPALAQDYRFTGFDAPQGATATVNLRIPLTRTPRQRPTFGITAGFGRSTASHNLDGQLVTRPINVVDIRFSQQGELRQARFVGTDLANLDEQRRRMNLTGEGNTLWIVVGLVAAGVAVCLLADCFEGDEDSDSSSS
jgi:hypothetical protein